MSNSRSRNGDASYHRRIGCGNIKIDADASTYRRSVFDTFEDGAADDRKGSGSAAIFFCCKQAVKGERFDEHFLLFRVTAEAGLERFIQHWDLEQKLNFIPKKTDLIGSCLPTSSGAITLKLIYCGMKRRGRNLEGELRALMNEKEQAPADMPISWNHTEFQTRYPSLQDEVKIGDYYLRLLLQEADESATPIHNPTEFFNNVYHRFLLSSRSEMRCLCLRAMAVTYGRHHMTIGPFEDARHFVSMLAKCTNAAERDHFTNVIEASADQLTEGNSAEWYYAASDNNKERLGPFSFEKMKTLYGEKKIFEKTAVWAAGMEKWEPLSKVPQFRWTVCLGNQQVGTPLYNFTQLCSLCLDIMIQMCEFFPSRDENNSVVRPMPQVKKSLTEPVLLYQVVQLLLTYDPSIVQRVATLVHLVMQALYQYCPIPLIDYPELQNELFCYVYYLRHLCDRQRFPDWEIRDPIPFLRACLAAWFEELEKKPPVMSVEQARETLDLGRDSKSHGYIILKLYGKLSSSRWQDLSVIRRAYFKLAARYHPDKNPEGQLSAYKYAGYGQLIRTIDLEAKNSSLFQEGGGALLSAAVELANHTLMSSALNAEQLRREQGLEALQIAFDRCVPVITASSTPTDMAVQVLKTLNCNTENPYLIWDNGTRAEVLEFVERHRTSREQTSELFGAEFQLSIHAKELIVGDIFVRIYNEQPTFVLQEPKKVAMDLLDFMGRHAPELTGQLKKPANGDLIDIDWSSSNANKMSTDEKVVMCTEALANLVSANPARSLILNTLIALSSNGQIVKEMLEYGEFCVLRISTMFPLHGNSMVVASGGLLITMFDSTNENPELIWNETTRAKVRQIIERGTENLYRAQSKNPEHKWDTGSLTDNTCAYSDSVTGELVVGGVFVRLYVANPAWAVRHPRQFATELIEKVLELMNKPSADLTLVTTAFIELLRNFPNTADQYCADALSRINCIEGIMTSMKNQPTLMHESAHALKCLMKRNNGDLAAQMLSTKMVDYLLEVLHGDLPGVSNSPAARAEIVDALKSACLDLQVGEKISEILNRSPVWAQYRDQRHDLFLPAPRTQAITGTSTGVAGYLTEGMFSPPPLHTQPPPMEKSGF
ncbi:DnaJ domain protein [Teladorsagia circumcincta]|uniref:DnaJ domain protein n=2 Tax=Teladorsagia circumcincta TaxID=45464 RepID=A0A2G9V6Y1_TELCI|nr:DnaJ domain protein [Teladorsagia circumcincta]